jgi:non-homologous end joining protein Ku
VRADPIHPAEKDLAAKLIDATAQPIVWPEYRDDSAEQLAALVRAALEKRPLTPPPSEPVPVLPLLEALQESVAAALRTQTPATIPSHRDVHGRNRGETHEPTFVAHAGRSQCAV